MQKMSGKKFDQAWVAAMVKGHQKAVELFTTESCQMKDADTRMFVDATLPVLHTHLDMAQQVQQQLALPDTRDKAMGSMNSLDSAFSPTSPAAATTSPTMPVPAHTAGVPE
jgi:putative membrane protein